MLLLGGYDGAASVGHSVGAPQAAPGDIFVQRIRSGVRQPQHRDLVRQHAASRHDGIRRADSCASKAQLGGHGDGAHPPHAHALDAFLQTFTDPRHGLLARHLDDDRARRGGVDRFLVAAREELLAAERRVEELPLVVAVAQRGVTQGAPPTVVLRLFTHVFIVKPLYAPLPISAIGC